MTYRIPLWCLVFSFVAVACSKTQFGPSTAKQEDPAATQSTVNKGDGCAAALVNASFEEPIVAKGSDWKRVDTVPGWQGPADLHREAALPASAGSQVIDLNQDGPGYIKQSVLVKRNLPLQLRWAQGINVHCASTAQVAILIDGRNVGTSQSSGDVKYHVVNFVAANDVMELAFHSETQGCGAATIDDVSLTCAPPGP